MDSNEGSTDSQTGPDSLVGIWEYDGERYIVSRSPEGGLLAIAERDGSEVGAGWVCSRGNMVADRAPASDPIPISPNNA
jgi:hypothetical protein